MAEPTLLARGLGLLSFVVFIIMQGLTSQCAESPFFHVSFPVLNIAHISLKVRFIANKNENNVALTLFQENKKGMHIDLISVLSSLCDSPQWFITSPPYSKPCLIC
jgi:hypothetical protein